MIESCKWPIRVRIHSSNAADYISSDAAIEINEWCKVNLPCNSWFMAATHAWYFSDEETALYFTLNWYYVD